MKGNFACSTALLHVRNCYSLTTFYKFLYYNVSAFQVARTKYLCVSFLFLFLFLFQIYLKSRLNSLLFSSTDFMQVRSAHCSQCFTKWPFLHCMCGLCFCMFGYIIYLLSVSSSLAWSSVCMYVCIHVCACLYA